MPQRECPTCQQLVDEAKPFCPHDGTPLDDETTPLPTSDSLIGKCISERYRVIRKLAQGGMGEIFVAEHQDIEKKLALKVLKHEYSNRPDIVARFRQEAISASRIKHPNVVDVFDFGQLEDGRFFLAMELLEGEDLGYVLASHHVLEPTRGVRIALQMCRALAAAHAKGVVHRDLKPENIFLALTPDREEIVKILDFGIAKLRNIDEPTDSQPRSQRRSLTQMGMVFGTPEYMAPEQAAGRAVDDKTDIYAVGIILYEMFSGQVPFYGESFMATLSAHIHDTARPIREVNPRTGISHELEVLIMKAIEKRPEDRFASMTECVEALALTPEAAALASYLPPSSRRAPLATTQVPLLPSDLSPPPPPSLPPESLPAPSSPLSAEATPHTSTRLTLALAAVGVGGVALAGLLVALTRSQPASFSQADKQALEQNVSLVAPTTSSPAPVPSASLSAASAAPSSGSVLIHIATEPAGAVIKKREGDSLLQVCAASPCDYPAQLDEKVELVAERGSLRGQGAVLARTAQTLTITLRAAAPTSSRPSGGRRTNLCEFCVPSGDPDCIKVISPCDRPPR